LFEFFICFLHKHPERVTEYRGAYIVHELKQVVVSCVVIDVIQTPSVVVVNVKYCLETGHVVILLQID
jgi:hypothetical protein